MYCNQCGSKLKDGAKFCAICGEPVPPAGVPSVTKTEKPRKKTGLIIIAAALLVCLLTGTIIGGIFLVRFIGNHGVVSQTTENKSVAVATEPPIVTQADALAEEFRTNITSADEHYQNKVLTVTGNVITIEKDVYKHTFLCIDSEDIHCYLTDDDTVGVNVGDTVTLTGVYKGVFDTDVYLEECKIK